MSPVLPRAKESLLPSGQAGRRARLSDPADVALQLSVPLGRAQWKPDESQVQKPFSNWNSSSISGGLAPAGSQLASYNEPGAWEALHRARPDGNQMNPRYKSRFRTGVLLRFPVGLPQRDHNSQATTSLAHGRLSIGLAPMEAATDQLTIQTRGHTALNFTCTDSPNMRTKHILIRGVRFSKKNFLVRGHI